MPSVRIVHTSRYRFEEPVSQGRFRVRLRPLDLARQTVTLHQLVLRPRVERSEARDRFGNHHTSFELAGPCRRLEVSAVSELELWSAREDEDQSPPWELARRVPGELDGELDDPAVRRAAAQLSEGVFSPSRPLHLAARALEERLAAAIIDDPAAVFRPPPLVEVFQAGRGVCADQARAALACLRLVGLEGRFVGGYLVGPLLPGRIQRSEAHAWAAVRRPDGGWIDIDPRRSGLEGVRPVIVARGVDAGDTSPLQGEVVGGGRQQLEVEVTFSSLER